MSCEAWERRIALAAEGDLSGGETARLRSHLQGCPSCRDFLEELRASQAALKSLAHESADERLLQAIRLDVLEEIQSGAAKVQGSFGWVLSPPWEKPRLAAGALLAVMLVALGWWAGLSRDPGELARGQSARSPSPELAEAESRVQGDSKSPTAVPPARREVLTKTGPNRSSPGDRAAAGGASGGTAPPATRGGESGAGKQPAGARLATAASGNRARRASNAPDAAGASPRYELVSMPSGETATGSVSGDMLLKIATNDPRIVIYWVLDEDGGNHEEPNEN